MNNTSTRIYSVGFGQVRTYTLALAFIVGNILFPQLCHLMPNGGLIWLPIYFFTLIGAFKYGWRVGILTAIASPLVNFWLFGMPAANMLSVIIFKSLALALVASYAAHQSHKVTPILLAAVVVAYQLIGIPFEWIMTSSLASAIQDIRMGIPGLVIQVLGGWAVLKYVLKN